MTTTQQPEASILTALQELLDAYNSNSNSNSNSNDEQQQPVIDYETAIQKCTFLLKKKKALDSSLTASVQRMLLISWLNTKDYQKVMDWVSQQQNQNQNQQPHGQSQSQGQTQNETQELALYAQYGLEKYDQVAKQAKLSTASSTSSSSSTSILEQHLLAQSYFHLNQTKSALDTYQTLLKNSEEEEERQMEFLTNSLAALASNPNHVVPYVPLLQSTSSDDDTAAITSSLMKQAATLLHQTPEYSDLALNLGTLECLTEFPSSPNNNNDKENWLEHAKANPEDPEDLVTIDINLAWSHHFWHQDDDEDFQYNTTKGKPNSPQLAVAKLNQALLNLDLTSTSSSSSLPSQPHAKWNLLQVRMYWYNRAVQQFKSNQLVECQESCQSLKKTFSVLSMGAGGGGADGGKKNKKKKKTTTATASSSEASASGSAATAAPPAEWWWSSRANVLLAHVLQQQSKTQQGIAKLEETLEGLNTMTATTTSQSKSKSSSKNKKNGIISILDHATAYVQLHLQALQHPDSPSKEQTQALLQSLPASIQSQPAVQATLEVLGANQQQSSSSSSSSSSKKNTSSPTDQADALFLQGHYEEAAKQYEAHLPDLELAQQLRQVQALAMSDQHEASTQLWTSLESSLGDPTSTTPVIPDGFLQDGETYGEGLERQGLPRNSTTTASSSLAAATTNTADNNDRSQDKILRQRARQREVHLKKLEVKGEYNPDRPSKPNPERWIPKQERSRARRRGGQQHQRSAQGGGSQADAQRLDAAARRAGTVPAASGRSTANIKVSANGMPRKGGRRR